MKNKEIYANHFWWINVTQYFQVGETFTGKRWRMCYDDDFIADFDHQPSMTECMEALVKWWG
jgi:hypothetical protein